MNKLFSENKSNLCFTGHRFISFGRQHQLKQRLREVIIEEYNLGIRSFYNGMAVGFDLLAAEVVLSLKASLKDIRLVAVVPFRGQSERFSNTNKSRYQTLLKQADEVIVLREYYCQGCLLQRNDYMLAHCSRVVTYFDGEPKGGTFYTYRKAKAKGLSVRNLF